MEGICWRRLVWLFAGGSGFRGWGCWFCGGGWFAADVGLGLVFVLVFCWCLAWACGFCACGLGLGVAMDEPESLILAQSERWRHA